jgi:hypothetical protein
MSRKLTVPGEITADGPGLLSAGALTNATSTGDAGSRADHFTGTSLDAAWATIGTAPASGPTVKYSVASLIAASSAGQMLRSFTPSGAFRVEACMKGMIPNGTSFGLYVRDSGATDPGTDGILIWVDGAAVAAIAYTLDSGSFTQRGSGVDFTFASAPWHYQAIERNGSNQWTAQVSQDRVTWKSIFALQSKTFTVAKVGFRYVNTGNSQPLAIDFIDVVS